MSKLNKPILLRNRFGIKIKAGCFKVHCQNCEREIVGSYSIRKKGGVKLVVNGLFHHVDQNRENNTFENILLLCEQCHCKIHGFKYYEPKPIDYEKAKADIHKIAELLD